METTTESHNLHNAVINDLWGAQGYWIYLLHRSHIDDSGNTAEEGAKRLQEPKYGSLLCNFLVYCKNGRLNYNKI